jgi:AAA domain
MNLVDTKSISPDETVTDAEVVTDEQYAAEQAAAREADRPDPFERLRQLIDSGNVERASALAKQLAVLRSALNDSDGESQPLVRELDEFIATKGSPNPPLIGTEDDNLQPALGLTLTVAKGGKGKTTLGIEKVLHLASGVEWLGFEVPRPVNVLIIENEGPREPFRRKLERRLEHWPHELKGHIYIYDESWGSASLKDPRFVERLRAEIERLEIYLVFADPLDSLGMDGEGSPSETRAMVDRFKAAGLFDLCAWDLVHHSRKESVSDAIDEASGAWGGRPDTMLGLEKLPGNKARLHFRKVRWGKRDGFTYRLDFDPETEAFTFEGEGTSEVRDLIAEIQDYLSSRGPSTAKEVAAPVEGRPAGIGARYGDVKAALEENEGRFRLLNAEEKEALSRHPSAHVWGLVAGDRDPGVPVA